MKGIKGVKELISAAHSFKNPKKTPDMELEEQYTKSYFGSLPNEILIHTFTFLNLEDLRSSRTVCTSWKVAIDSNLVSINRIKRRKLKSVINASKKTYKCFASKALICMMISFCLLMVCLMVGVGMGSYLVHQVTQSKRFVSSECTITGSVVNVDSCATVYSTQTCYYPVWTVTYKDRQGYIVTATIEGDNSDTSSDKSFASGRLSNHPVGTTETCYYDVKDEKSVQWTIGSYTISLIITVTMGIAFIVLCFCTVCSFCIWSKRSAYSKTNLPSA